MSNIRIADLDVLIQKGLKSRPHTFEKYDVNIGVIQNVIERIASFKTQYLGVCVVCQDINEDEVISARDPLGRLAYEILSEKLPSMVTVKHFHCRQEMVDYVFGVCSEGMNHSLYGVVRVLMYDARLLTLQRASTVFAMDTDEYLSYLTPEAMDNEVDVVAGSYLSLYYLRKYFPEKYKEIYYDYKNSINVPDLPNIGVFFQFLLNSMSKYDLSEDTLQELGSELISNKDITGYKEDIIGFDKYNVDAMIDFCNALNMRVALELLKAYPEDNDTPAIRNHKQYMRNKLGEYVKGEFSLKNNISLDTEYFSESLKITDHFGNIVSENSQDKELSEKELLNEFL